MSWGIWLPFVAPDPLAPACGSAFPAYACRPTGPLSEFSPEARNREQGTGISLMRSEQLGSTVCPKRLVFRRREVATNCLLGSSAAVGQNRHCRCSPDRGIVVYLLATSNCAAAMGLGWEVGTLVATFAMAGDLFSSFVKRRLHLPSSSMAIGLDHIPESLFPSSPAGGYCR